jgi:superfamily II DNA helicase RecQ
MSHDRLVGSSEFQDPELALQQRRAVRRMFELADGSGCLWQRLARHFAEEIAACGRSCGNCLPRDIVGAARPGGAPPEARAPSGRAPATAGWLRPRDDPGAGPVGPQADAPEPAGTIGGHELLERLRALRRKLADERKVPAFVVFSDRSLQDMVARRPGTAGEFLEVYGVGRRKLEEYGECFLAELRRAT